VSLSKQGCRLQESDAKLVANVVEHPVALGPIAGSAVVAWELQRELHSVSAVEVAECEPDEGEPTVLDDRPVFLEQIAGSAEHITIGVSGLSERVRTSPPPKVVVAEPERDRTSDLLADSQAPGDSIDKPEQDRVDLGSGSLAPTERLLRSNRSSPTGDLDRPRIVVVSQSMQVPPGSWAENGDKRAGMQLCDVTHGANAFGLEFVGGDGPNAPESPDR